MARTTREARRCLAAYWPYRWTGGEHGKSYQHGAGEEQLGVCNDVDAVGRCRQHQKKLTTDRRQSCSVHPDTGGDMMVVRQAVTAGPGDGPDASRFGAGRSLVACIGACIAAAIGAAIGVRSGWRIGWAARATVVATLN